MRGARGRRLTRATPPSRTSRSTHEHEPAVVPDRSTPYGRGPGTRHPLRHRPGQAAGRRRDDGRRQRRPRADRRARAARRAGRRRRRRLALHGGGQQVGGPLLKSDALARRRAVAATGSPGSAPTTRPTRSRRTRPSSSARSGSSPTTASRSASSSSPRHAACAGPVAEIPTIWLDRAIGASNFKVVAVDPAVPALVPLRVRPQLSLDESRRGAPQERSHDLRERDPEKVLVTGSAGFIGGYVVEELLRRGYAVVGIDNLSKYGKVAKSYDDHPRLRRSSRATRATSS